MYTNKPTPEFEDKLRAAIGAQDPDAGFTKHLRSTLIKEAKNMNNTHNNSRLVWRWVLAGLCALLLVFVAAGPQRTVSAFLNLIGYIPGVGFVQDQATLRTLSQPEIVERDGVTLTVEQAVADSERTIVIYKIEGVYPLSQGGATSCLAAQRILLPDGTALEPSSSMGNNINGGYSFKLVFPALPEDNEVVLEIPCLWDAAPGAAPENWQITLNFAAANTEIEPVADVKGPKSKSDGITLALDKVVTSDDGYILFASLEWSEKDFQHPVWPDSVTITDGNDHDLPFEMTDTEEPILDPTQPRFPLAYKIIGNDITRPVTLTIDKIQVTLPSEVVFQFDPGPNPQPGQVWTLNIDVDVEGYTIHVVSAKMISDQFSDGVGFEFTMQASPDVRGASLQDMEHPILAGGGGGGPNGQFTGSFIYDGELPAGTLNITITTITVTLEGNWQVTWK